MNASNSADDRLDQILASALPAPALPAGFRQRLGALVARSADLDIATRRMMLERERRELLAGLHSDSVQLRWRTLGYVIGGAFSAGALVAIGLPWIRETFGVQGVIALPTVGAAIGLAIGAISYLRRVGPPRWLS